MSPPPMQVVALGQLTPKSSPGALCDDHVVPSAVLTALFKLTATHTVVLAQLIPA
jgi:hypothetical protein